MALESLKTGLKERVRACEHWWFDTTRHVQTSGLVRRPSSASKIVGELRDSNMYGPVRVANAHAALRDLPLGGLGAGVLKAGALKAGRPAAGTIPSTRLSIWGRERAQGKVR